MFKFSKNFSVATRVILSVGFVLSFAFIIATISIQHYVKIKMTDSYMDSVTNLFNTFEEGVRGSLERGQMKNFTRLLQQQKQIKGVLEASLFTKEGKLDISSNNTKDLAQKLPDELFRQLDEEKELIIQLQTDKINIYAPQLIKDDCIRCHIDWQKGKQGGILFFSYDIEPLKNTLSHLQLVLLGGSFLLLIITITVILIVMRRQVSQPISQTVHMIQEMGKGHINERLHMDRYDEIGQMADAMDKFADNLQSNLVDALQKMANGDFDFATHQFDDRDILGQALKKMTTDLNSTLGQIRSSGEEVNAVSGQISTSSQSVSQGAAQSAASLEEITSSMVEMGSQTTTTAENAAEANKLANQTRESAQKGNSQIQTMVQAMDEIKDSGKNISKIIKVIDEIAFQTNLLALNAAVEAARAGRHGKGFAVVAEEVRNLANRSAKAAGQTTELIENSVQKTTNGTTIANQTADALDEIVNDINKVTSLVSDISAASAEQAKGISLVNEGLGQIDRVTQQNTVTAEESASAAEQLTGQAAQLQAMLAHFKLKRP